MSSDMDMNGADDGEDTILAAEYVLHLLPATERQAVEERLDVDGGFRALVDRWTEDLSSLADEIPPVDPPVALRERVAQSVAAAPPIAREAKSPRRSWLSGALFGSLALAAVVVLLALFLPQIDLPGQGGEQYAADIAAQERSLVVAIRYDATDNVLVIRKEAGTVAEGRDLEVWLLTEDQPPHSVGVLPDGGDVRIDVSPFWGQRIPSGSFAVSDEPAGGSPTGLPTGEVIAVAPVSDI